VLNGAEHVAIERLIRASDISAAARLFLAKTATKDSPMAGGVPSPQRCSSAPHVEARGVARRIRDRRLGGQAQLARTSRDVEAALRSLPYFPDSHRLANIEGGRELIEDTLGDLLRDTALELYDIDLAYGVSDGGEHVFTWRQESQRTADVMLLKGLILKMELMLTAEPASRSSTVPACGGILGTSQHGRPASYRIARVGACANGRSPTE